MEKVGDYLEQKIGFADRMLVKHAIQKIQVRVCVCVCVCVWWWAEQP